MSNYQRNQIIVYFSQIIGPKNIYRSNLNLHKNTQKSFNLDYLFTQNTYKKIMSQYNVHINQFIYIIFIYPYFELYFMCCIIYCYYIVIIILYYMFYRCCATWLSRETRLIMCEYMFCRRCVTSWWRGPLSQIVY